MDNSFVFPVGCVSVWLEKSKMLVHLKIPRTLLCRPQGTAFRRTLTATKYPTDVTEYGGYWPVSFVKFHGLSQAAEAKRLGSKSNSPRVSFLACWSVSDAELVPSALCSQVHPETWECTFLNTVWKGLGSSCGSTDPSSWAAPGCLRTISFACQECHVNSTGHVRLSGPLLGRDSLCLCWGRWVWWTVWTRTEISCLRVGNWLIKGCLCSYGSLQDHSAQIRVNAACTTKRCGKWCMKKCSYFSCPRRPAYFSLIICENDEDL